MKKRFTGILLCMLMFCMSIFTGCSLVTKDMAKYLATTVVEIKLKEPQGNANDTIKIEKRDLISAYNTYGYYYQQYGYSQEEALNMTVDLLISRRITIAKAEEFYPELSVKEKTYLWSETYDALNDNFNSYLDKVLGITDSGSSKDEDEVKFDGYEKNALLKEVEGKLVIDKTKSASKKIDEFSYTIARDFDNETDRELIYSSFVKFVSEQRDKNYTEAFNDYFKALLKNEEGQKLSEDKISVFAREIKRLYKVVYENYMIEKYQEYYTTDESNESYISAKQIVDLYSSKVRASYTKYEIEGAETYDTDMTKGANSIYYYKDEGTKFFKVAHILFKFNDEQSARYKQIESEYKSGKYTKEVRDAELDKLYASIVPIAREKNADGIYEEKENKASYEKSTKELRDYIANEVAKEQGKFNKADRFNELIYQYNEDPGMMNPSDIYTIGVDSEGNAVSSFVPEFNEAGIELYNKGNGQVGDISGLVRTENGLHVLFYAGEIENLYDGINEKFSLSDEAVVKLYNERPNILLNKTYFDSLYDELVTDNYAIFENLQMNEIKKAYTITVYPDSYKDLKG
jgi:hypothetical protein